MVIERYSHVMHLVSEVRGTLRRRLDALAALAACFPAGTVSGAPKVRAMEIIDELEPVRRGPYAGAVGYIGWGARTLDTAIAIRTVVMKADRAWVQAGAGIVADSDPHGEWRETEAKARAVLAALGLAGQRGSGRRELAVPPCPFPDPPVDIPIPMPFKLVRVTGDQDFELSAEHAYVVGRAVTSDIPIFDPTISRRHAELVLSPTGVTVKDLGSSNGTFINGARVTEGTLAANDSVTFGKVVFQLKSLDATRFDPPGHQRTTGRPARPSFARSR